MISTGRIRHGVLALSRGLDLVASVVTCAALVILVAAVLLQVVARYVFQQPPAYTEELARYAMIWAGLVGASMAFKRRFDPALANLAENLTGWAGLLAEALRSLVVLIYLGPVLFYCFFGPGMNPARGFLLRHSRTAAEALPFNTIWVAIAVPVMIVFILIHLLARWLGDSGPQTDTSME